MQELNRRFLVVMLVAVLLASAVLVGCGPKEPAAQNGEDKERQYKAVLLLAGNLGDMSFLDSANRGMQMIKEELGWEVKVIEMGTDPSAWEPTLTDVSTQDWDLIITGTFNMQTQIEEVAPRFPDKKYVLFDVSVDYEKGDYSNVYSILYRQNEGSYLAGALAAMVTTSDMPRANPEKLIGFLGGMDAPVINDFLVGYIEGAKSIDPEIKVAVSYVESYSDPAKGKEMCLAQYDMGVDIGFNVAGGSGLGQLDAAKERGLYAIGVDSDQAMLFKDSDPEKAELVLTSMLKRVDNSLLRAAKLFQEGKLEFGKAESLGLKEDAVGLAINEFYERNVPEEMRVKLQEIADKIKSGEIQVPSAFEMGPDAVKQLRDSVAP
ncbi:MAG: BMP family ABC transporter substrate-binding protein [Bacillota bacterium]|nr:BMP family ABC transporter substrate-binding protein [Bacillota bacterium]HPT35760.1 BMP family ABC transporter substrate-binding protein [Bacillota bacterium]HPZ85675.1 BMP family ABC transporter substrate-binding protein [Bacillota bacterium]HQD86249.1 BMP family ABC transporter substrate-binding protein [Bacillota bacterium]